MFSTHHKGTEAGTTSRSVIVPPGKFQTDPEVTGILKTAIAGLVEKMVDGSSKITYLSREE